MQTGSYYSSEPSYYHVQAAGSGWARSCRERVSARQRFKKDGSAAADGLNGDNVHAAYLDAVGIEGIIASRLK